MEYWKSMKHIMHYLNGTREYWLLYKKEEETNIVGYLDTDWAGDLDDRRSTSGYQFKLSGAVVSWRRKRHTCVALFTTEAEYMAMAIAAQETVCIQHLQSDRLSYDSIEPTLIYQDNQSTIWMAKNPQYQWRAKHTSENRLRWKTSKHQTSNKDIIAVVLTKGIVSAKFVNLRELLDVKKN